MCRMRTAMRFIFSIGERLFAVNREISLLASCVLGFLLLDVLFHLPEAHAQPLTASHRTGLFGYSPGELRLAGSVIGIAVMYLLSQLGVSQEKIRRASFVMGLALVLFSSVIIVLGLMFPPGTGPWAIIRHIFKS
jgi:hypothetical protein